jgi:hypothetical protein
VESVPHSKDVAPVTVTLRPVTESFDFLAGEDVYRDKYRLTRTHFPLLDASALNPWDIQGMSISKYGIAFDNSRCTSTGFIKGKDSHYGIFYVIMSRCTLARMFLVVHEVTLAELNRAHPAALAFDTYFRTHPSNEVLLPMDIKVSPTGHIDFLREKC